MNCVSLAGRIYDDPVKFESNNGVKCCRFKMTVDRAVKDNDRPFEIFEVVVFKNLADLNYEIGQFVGVIGRLQSNNYEKDGKSYYNASIIGGNVSFLGK